MKASRLAKLHAAVSRHACETVRIIPQQGGGYLASSVDFERLPLDIAAYVAMVPAATRTSGNAANSGHNVELRASADTIKFTTSLLPYELRAGDLVEMVSQDASPKFRVSRVAPFGVDRTVAFLVRAA